MNTKIYECLTVKELLSKVQELSVPLENMKFYVIGRHRDYFDGEVFDISDLTKIYVSADSSLARIPPSSLSQESIYLQWLEWVLVLY